MPRLIGSAQPQFCAIDWDRAAPPGAARACGKGLPALTEAGAFAGIITSPLGERTEKPRLAGQTMVIDKGLGLSETGDLLELAHPWIDYVKLGFGTPALYSPHLLRAKISLIRSYGVHVYPGGTFLEIALYQGNLERYLERLREFGFDLVEVSDGTIALSEAERRAAIRTARAYGFGVITEVGKKDGAAVLDPRYALEQVQADLEEGAVKVIVEGRESGRGAGIYDPEGRPRTAALEALIDGLADPSVLMWETPLKAQQEEMILRFGPNVNLGNIAAPEILAVEALRQGLRGDTFRAAVASSAAMRT